MLNKIISKFKPTQAAKQSEAEVAMLSLLASPEKTAQLIAQLEAAVAVEVKHSPRHTLFAEKLKQANLALSRQKLEAERRRVAELWRRDQATANKALKDAEEEHSIATNELALRESKRTAVVQRLAPLEQEHLAVQKVAAKRVEEAQSAFNAAIALDDPEAEARAAQVLYQANKECESGAGLSGPLGLRIDALKNEIQSHSDAVTSSQTAVEGAEQAVLHAKADIALLDYDRAAQALLDAFVTQRVAVANAFASNRGPHDRFISSLGAQAVDGFEAQVSSSERIVFGGSIDAYNQRHLPRHVVDQLWREGKPNLVILMANPDDLAAESLASHAEESAPVTEDAV